MNRAQRRAGVVDDLMGAVPDLDADVLAARQLAAITAALGHEPTLDELKAAMIGASYVIEVARMVHRNPMHVVNVEKAAEAAMAVWAWNVEVKAHEEAEHVG